MSIVTIVGAGLMGSATAYPLSDNGHTVRLMGTHLDGDIITSCRERRYHPRLKRELPAAVQTFYVDEVAQALDGAEVIVSGVNSMGVHWIGRTIGPHLRPGQLIIAITKGLEVTGDGHLAILPDVLASELPAGIREQVKLAAVGGPCIAGELAGRRQSCVVFGSRDGEAVRKLAGLFHTPYYHIWTTTDLLGLEVSRGTEECLYLGRGASRRFTGARRRGRCRGRVYAQPGSRPLWAKHHSRWRAYWTRSAARALLPTDCPVPATST